MKAKLAIIALGALVLMAPGANAQNRNYSHGYARGETPRYHHREAFTGLLRKGSSRIQIWIDNSM
jgi:hypothetical protein